MVNNLQSAIRNQQPAIRPRRLRQTAALRSMVRETELNARDFIYPLFVRHGAGRAEIRSMPGVSQLSVDEAVREAEAAASLGVPAVILFGIPAEKDPVGRENFAHDGIVQQTIRAIKKEIPEMVVVTDVCLCEYTDHGHCGILNVQDGAKPRPSKNLPEGYVLNDPTLDILSRVAVSHAECGADIVAPSGMMDGMVAAIRVALDDFGTGYASLTHLKRFPVDEIKIDRSFVSDLTRDANDAAIVTALLRLGRSLGLDVTAEGVETSEQAMFLDLGGCTCAQGYLYSRPMAGRDVPPYLERPEPALPPLLAALPEAAE